MRTNRSSSTDDDGGPGAPHVPLPPSTESDPGAIRTRTRELFDGVAEAYDAARPGYPDDLFTDFQKITNISPVASVLEIGCGTGQATRQLATLAGSVHCVELGDALAGLARRNLAAYRNVEVHVGAFETAVLPRSNFDAVFSATAFHWIDPAISYARAAAFLADRGHLALVTNAHVHGGTQTEIFDAVAELHRRLLPQIGPWRFLTTNEVTALTQAGGDIARVWWRVERSFHAPPPVGDLFEEPVVRTYPHLVTYDTAGYLTMLASQSSYAALTNDQRAPFFEAVGALIADRLGGAISKEHLAILAVARRMDSG